MLYEPFGAWLNYQLTLLAAAISQRDVVPTYAFPIVYAPGGHIEHRDVADNYYSLTYSAHGSMPGGDIASGLVFVDSESNNINMDDPNTKVWRRHTLCVQDLCQLCMAL